MVIQLSEIISLLKKDSNFRELITENGWYYSSEFEASFSNLTYNSKEATSDSVFFIKGLNFKKTYLEEAIQNGLNFYISETDYEVSIPAVIVNDVKQAMSIIAQAFYNYPNNKLKIIAFTGTKGKTTSAYFAYHILKQNPKFKVAMLSTMNTTLDGKVFFKSKLTTPESLDLIQMMANAVDNGMTHLIMEVSSQAYKTKRVYGLCFDIGVFLNISPDHIGPIEHPTFEDYFFCKRQLLHNSKIVIINSQIKQINLLKEESPTTTFYYNDKKNYIKISESFSFKTKGDIEGEFNINLLGKFNQENALAASLACQQAGATIDEIKIGLSQTKVPGRMEMLVQKNGAKVYVDYAHNKVSLENLIQVVKKNHSGKIIIVIGAPGNKAESRRKDFGEALTQTADSIILTSDDPNFENPNEIAAEIKAAITSDTPILTEIDRACAIQIALSQTKNQNDAVILAGKGADCYQIINQKHEYYCGDYAVAQSIIEQE